METKSYHKHISSKHNLLDLKLGEVWRYRDLITLFTHKKFAVTYKQTVLGPLWLFIKPLLTSVVYVILFGKIAGLSTSGVPQLLFYFSGNAIWTFFSNSVTVNSETFVKNYNLFGKVYFPRLTVPISNFLTDLVIFGIQMILVIVLLVYYCITGVVSPNWLEWLLLPVILLQLGLMSMGVGILISSWTTKYRDLSVLVTFGVSLWMYGTPVVYPLSQLNEGLLRTCIMINPVTAPVELYRHAILGTGTIMGWGYLWSWVFTLIVSIGGIIVFNKVERTFMDCI